MIATKIKDVVSKHGLSEVILNLEDRNKTPLILWVIDLLNNFSKLNKVEGSMSEINPMNNKKYIEAVSFRDWQTCDLICDEHSVLVGRINNLQKDLDLALNALQRESEVNEELEQELQKTREQLEEKDKEIEEYRLNAIGKINLEIAHENSELREQLNRKKQYFKDKQKDEVK